MGAPRGRSRSSPARVSSRSRAAPARAMGQLRSSRRPLRGRERSGVFVGSRSGSIGLPRALERCPRRAPIRRSTWIPSGTGSSLIWRSPELVTLCRGSCGMTTSNAATPHSASPGLHSNEMVFAAKATANTAADGQFQWTAVGRAGAPGTGVLDTTGGFGACAASAGAEASCSLNHGPGNDADPRVAAGTMTAGNPTVPWVVWDEGTGATPNNNQVFVARLVEQAPGRRRGSCPTAASRSRPVTVPTSRSRATRRTSPGTTTDRSGPVTTATPDQFVTDGSAVGASATDQVRAPISSACIATPFNADGQACQGAAIGTPSSCSPTEPPPGSCSPTPTSPIRRSPAPRAASAPHPASVNATVNPEGAAINVSFQFGTTTRLRPVDRRQPTRRATHQPRSPPGSPAYPPGPRSTTGPSPAAASAPPPAPTGH